MGRRLWLAAIVPGLMMNGFVLLIAGQWYTAWTIRTRNRMYYALLGREVNRQRAENADEIARGVVRWLRPLLLLAANALWIYIVVRTLREG